MSIHIIQWTEMIVTLALGTLVGWLGERFGKVSDRLHRLLMLAVNASSEIRISVRFVADHADATLPRLVYISYQGQGGDPLDLLVREPHRWAFRKDTTMHDLRRVGAHDWSYECSSNVRIKKATDFAADWLKHIEEIDGLPSIAAISVVLKLPYRRARVVIPGSRTLQIKRFEVTMVGEGSNVAVDLLAGNELQVEGKHLHDLRLAIQSAL